MALGEIWGRGEGGAWLDRGLWRSHGPSTVGTAFMSIFVAPSSSPSFSSLVVWPGLVLVLVLVLAPAPASAANSPAAVQSPFFSLAGLSTYVGFETFKEQRRPSAALCATRESGQKTPEAKPPIPAETCSASLPNPRDGRVMRPLYSDSSACSQKFQNLRARAQESHNY
ncbi:hypothetical protein LZ30DRAFT_718402 [Colletotrichum cereale]|nr:hypothetical protein LZ30DRAFT_718402 [Colletotrichum cereale]